MPRVAIINAKYAGRCSGCRCDIFKGQQIGYTQRRTLCMTCARRIMIRNADADEHLKGAEFLAHSTKPPDD